MNLSFQCLGQPDTLSKVVLEKKDKVYCNPSLEGQGPSKGVILSYLRVFDSEISSESTDPEIGDAENTMERNNFLTFKAKIPIWNKPNLKILLGFRYDYQEFVFQNDTLGYDLYKNLEQKHLKTIGGGVNVLKSFNETSYLLVGLRGDLNGDYTVDELPTIDFLKVSFGAIYGRKPCPTRTHGFGLYYSYTFGRQRVLPAFLYNNTFSKHWGVELLLPSEAKLRYNFNRNTLLYLGAEVDGASYNLVFKKPPLNNRDNLQLRRSVLIGSLEFNREIYDFIWFGISAGIMQPISIKVVEENDRGTRISFKNGIKIISSDPLIDNQLATAPFVRISLFLVPPRKIENKILNPKS